LWWEYAAAILTAFASVAGSVWVVRAVVRHEQQACDARLDAFREGLERGEHEGDRG
jgi:hypothetical protein